MSRKWFVDPDTTVVQLGDGDWIEVKKRLTVGEERDAMKALYTTTGGVPTPDLSMIGIADVMAYLVDWSLTRDEKRVDISSDGKKLDALRDMQPDAFDVVHRAVKAHIDTMTAERDAAKNDQATSSASAATSISVA